MLDGFEDLIRDPEELLDLGDRVVSATRMSGHRSDSGVPVNQLLFQVFTLRPGVGGQAGRVRECGQALEAVGLRE